MNLLTQKIILALLLGILIITAIELYTGVWDYEN